MSADSCTVMIRAIPRKVDRARRDQSSFGLTGIVKGLPKRVQSVIRRFRAELLFIPPYRPDLNPIEQAFSKLKALLRANKLRTIYALWKALGSLVDCFTPEECTNFFRTLVISSQPKKAPKRLSRSFSAALAWISVRH
jgi:transposase